MQLPIRIDSASEQTLQAQIVSQVHALIKAGQLKPGTPVPSSRELSQQLHVSRNTVSEAYEELIDQGYLYTHRAVGTFVSQRLPDASIAALEAEGVVDRGRRLPAVNLPLPYTGRGPPGLHRPADPALRYDFCLGHTDPLSFPGKTWRRLLLDRLGGGAQRMSEYSDPAGLPELRQLIASHLGPARGMVVLPEQILITAGCQQGLALAAHLFVGSGTPVAVEAPCYRGAAFLFESYGGRLLPVPVDELGIDVTRLPEARVKLVYVTPSHQFPTGVTLALDRRIALLDWAARIGAFVLEVDYDADFRYEDSPLPSLWALDRNNCVIYMSSFSRSVGPGLRLGYMVLPRDLIRAATTLKGLIDNGSPWLEQATLAQFIRDGSLVTHLKRLRHSYRLRRDALLGALHRRFGPARISGVEAGMHIMWRLPPGMPAAEGVRTRARAEGVGVYPLADSPAHLFEQLDGNERALLLGYTHLPEARIEEGIAALAAALSK